MGSLGDEFMVRCKKALYYNFLNEEELVCHLKDLHEFVPEQNVEVRNHVVKLIGDRKKVCFTFSGENFICSNKGAASIAEANVSRLKSWGAS